MLRSFVFGGFGFVMALAAHAEPVTGKDAKRQLFLTQDAEVEVLAEAGLSEKDAAVLGMVAGAQSYYGAVALSPDEGLYAETTVAAAAYHDTETASAAALTGCEAKRKGKAPCVLVALVRPKGWEAGRIQLSAAATEAFGADYSKARAPKAMAVSVATGLWGIGSGEGAVEAALADCAARGNAVISSDCAIVIAE